MEVDRWRVSRCGLCVRGDADLVLFRWVGSMAVTGAILAKNPYLTFSQKVSLILPIFPDRR